MIHEVVASRSLIRAAAFVVAAGCLPAAAQQTGPAELLPPETMALTGALAPTGSPVELWSGLAGTPWDLVPLDSGSVLVSLRDPGVILEVTAGGERREIAQLPSIHDGSSGLLGIAVLPGDPSYLYAFYSAADDARVMRAPLSGAAGAHAVGEWEPVLTGIPRGDRHGGGRIGFGPDGMLYVATGDAHNLANAQDLGSLAGKILRLAPDGSVPAGNPFPDSLVWSYGHRNIEGLAWGADGTLWASEFGEDALDELNRIEPGGNYGWPNLEGRGGAPEFVDPVYEWSVADASPAGITVIGDTVFMAALRGEALIAIDVGSAEVSAERFYVGEFGRIRDVTPGPDGTLWLLTSNSDGMGSGRDGDERLLSVQLTAR